MMQRSGSLGRRTGARSLRWRLAISIFLASAMLMSGLSAASGQASDQYQNNAAREARPSPSDEAENEAELEQALDEFISERNEVICPSVNEGEVTLSGPNIVCYAQIYALNDTSREIRQGDPIEDGCSFREPRPAPGTAEVEIVYDPDTCRKIVEIGTPASDFDAAFPTDAGEPSSSIANSGTTEESGTTSDSVTTAALQRKWVYAWSWFDEPARWAPFLDCDVEEGVLDGCVLPPVNTVYNYIDSVPDGDCVLAPGHTAYWERELTWLAATGWFVREQDHETPPSTVTCPRDQLKNSSHVHFENRGFCFGILSVLGLTETHTHYEPNAVDIHADGTRHITQELRKRGGCSQLLRSGKKADRGAGQNRRFN